MVRRRIAAALSLLWLAVTAVQAQPDNAAQALRLGAVLKDAGIPTTIFGGKALDNALAGLPWGPGLALLAAYAAGCVALTPFAMAGACRNALS